MSSPTRSELKSFEKIFDPSLEDRARQARGRFLRLFPISNLRRLRINQYVIGLGTDSFCALVEPQTVAWAKIQGATAFKFGIYYGKTKSDGTRRYRFSRKFGADKVEAFAAVKMALLDLVGAGQNKNFSEIDANPLSQMFKAKILSLYFPDKYLNVCSADHIELFASEMGLPDNGFISELQYLLLKEKLGNPFTKNWSNPKFTRFLYDKYFPDRRPVLNQLRKAIARKHRKVDFEDIVAAWKAKGRRSEKYALKWELDRLIELGYSNPKQHITDRRDQPTYGYDFLSDASPIQKRYIEVKSARKNPDGYSFHLSENQNIVSKGNETRHRYYFYLVFYGSDGKPSELLPERADRLYKNSTLSPEAYLVEFDIGK